MDRRFFYLSCVIGLLILACKHESLTPASNWNYPSPFVVAPQPPFFPPMPLNPANPLNQAGIALGKALYYDPILSENGRSCSSCHWQNYAFSVDRQKIGLDTARYNDILSHQNLGWKSWYNWDGSVNELEAVPHADFGPDFFNTDMNAMKNRLINHPHYPRMFYESFGIYIGQKPEKLAVLIAYALAQHLRMQISANSLFDAFRLGNETLSPAAWRGFNIFFSEKGECFHCHGAPFFTDHDFHDIGLEVNPAGRNLGRARQTAKATDVGRFATPTLRNIAVTAPYMHDGRFQTLEEVIEHYSSGIEQSPNLDPLFYKQSANPGLRLTAQEKVDLLAFLQTLTDTSFIYGP